MTAPPHRTGLDAKALAVLHEFDPDGRLGTVARILRTYETTLPKQLAQLAAGRDDAQQVAFWAHTMKSASRAIGAVAFADACAAVEARLKDGDAHLRQDDVACLLADGEQALQAVRAVLRP